MPVNYYPNRSVEDLEKLLKRLQSRQMSGAVTEVFAAGVRTVREVGGNNSKPEVEILRVLYALFVKAAGTDDAATWPNPYLQRKTRTRPSYGYGGSFNGSLL